MRFLAFFLVFLSHGFGEFNAAGHEPWSFLQRLAYGGSLGVDIFFSLSGFLITSLLLKEEELSGRISTARFWGRRAFRIWPLYYLALLLGLFVLPRFAAGFAIAPSAQQALVRDFGTPMALFVGNWAFVVHSWPASPLLSPLWSVSVEEQFYVLWPAILSLFGWRWALRGAVLVIAAAPGLRWLQITLTPGGQLVHPALWTSSVAHVDVLLMGCVLAIIRERRAAWISFWTPGVAVTTAVIASAFLAIAMYRVDLIMDVHDAVAQCFGYSALAMATNVLTGSALGLPRVLSWPLRFAPIVWLGRISYGLYVYHLGVIATIRSLAPPVQTHTALVAWLVLEFVATVLIAGVSYLVFERRFLLLKVGLATIRSRPV